MSAEKDGETPAVPPANGECQTECRNTIDVYVDTPGDKTVRPRRPNIPRGRPPRLPPGQKPDPDKQ